MFILVENLVYWVVKSYGTFYRDIYRCHGRCSGYIIVVCNAVMSLS